MKRSISIFLGGLFIISLFSFISLNSFSYNASRLDSPNFFSAVENENWSSLTFEEQLKSLYVPDDYLKKLSTEDLVELALEYPFLCDVFLFDSEDKAVDYFKRTSNLFEELFNRSDCDSVMLKKYNELQVDYKAMVSKSSGIKDPFKQTGYLKEIFFQEYFVCNYNKLNAFEKVFLENVQQEKYAEKKGICQNYYTANILNVDKLNNSGIRGTSINIPKNIEINKIGVLSTDGFSSSGQIVNYLHGRYYAGSYFKYGTSAGCYKFYSDDISLGEKNSLNITTDEAHPSWTRLSGATRKYNCHSYAWLQQSFNNLYWLPNPNPYKNVFTYIGENCSASAKDMIVVTDYRGDITHSLVVETAGKSCNDIITLSKCGPAGVYRACLADIYIVYGENYEVYRQ